MSFILEVLVDRDCKISDFQWVRFDNTQSKKNTEEWRGSKSSFIFVQQFFFVSEIYGFLGRTHQREASNCFLLQIKPKRAAENFVGFFKFSNQFSFFFFSFCLFWLSILLARRACRLNHGFTSLFLRCLILRAFVFGFSFGFRQQNLGPKDCNYFYNYQFCSFLNF